MTYASLAEAVDGFKQDADRTRTFSNGGPTDTYTTTDGTQVPSVQKFLADKDSEINVAADGILAEAVDQANAAAQSATNAGNSETMAMNWATKIGSAVVAGFYSAKEWAVGTFTRGIAGGGSAKDWATYIGGTVDDSGYSAKKYSQDAGSSAATAQAAATQAQTAIPPVQVVDYAALWAYTGTGTRIDVTAYLVTAAPSGIYGPFTRDDSDTTSGAYVTGSISGTTLTVSAVTNGAVAVGMAVRGAGWRREPTSPRLGLVRAASAPIALASLRPSRALQSPATTVARMWSTSSADAGSVQPVVRFCLTGFLQIRRTKRRRGTEQVSQRSIWESALS